MIGYITGKVVDLSPSQTYIDIGGLGYEVFITLNTYEAINGKETVKLYTHLQIKEDAWSLFGFATTEEKEAFQRLLSVSGVGAATARLMLSSVSPSALSLIVSNGDSKALEKLKGIGAKTAQRIILELKGKLPEYIDDKGEKPHIIHNTIDKDALSALLGLGIAKNLAEAAITKAKSQIKEEDLSVEALIKVALKSL